MKNLKTNSTDYRAENTRIITNALLKGEAKFVWVKSVSGKQVKVLKESLHKNETIFFDAGNEVDYDKSRHKTNSNKLPSPLERGRG